MRKIRRAWLFIRRAFFDVLTKLGFRRKIRFTLKNENYGWSADEMVASEPQMTVPPRCRNCGKPMRYWISEGDDASRYCEITGKTCWSEWVARSIQ